MDRRHVVLLRTPPVLPQSSVTAQQGVPSLGLAYLGAGLKKSGFDVTYIDSLGEKLNKYHSFGIEGILAAGLNIEEILQRIPNDVGLIAVSCQFSNDWIYAKKILKTLNNHFPHVPMICGGEHTTADFERVLQACPFLTACVLGEGDETMCELAENLASGHEIKNVNGIAYLDANQKVTKTCGRRRKKEIDEIPWPDWESLPLNKYLDAGLGMAAQGIRSMPVLASRGCPFRCTFCSSPQMWEPKWYGRNVDDILAEVKSYIAKYKVEHIEFYDMSPSTNRKWLEALTARMATLGISWNFPSGMRIENLTGDLLWSFKEAGCYKMTFALETSAPQLIKQLKKKVNPVRMLGLIREAVKSGLITKVNFIWGLPNQTKWDILRDYWYLIKLAVIGLHDATCFAFVPYPGSEDFNRLSREGKIPAGDQYELFLAFNVYNNPFKMRSWSEHIKDWHMTYWTLGGMALFYSLQFTLRPWRFVNLYFRLRKHKPKTMLELALFSLFNAFVIGRKRRVNTHAA